MKKVLILEDEVSIRSFVVINLNRAGYETIEAGTGEEALEQIRKNPDTKVALLDIMLPKINGYELFAYLREYGIPAIFITAKGEIADKTRGFHMGADDYLAKPFGMMEMVSRVKAVLRRANRTHVSPALTHKGIELNESSHQVFVDGKKVELTVKEYQLLRLFLKNPGVAFTRENLLSSVWESEFQGETRTVDVHIASLRMKLGSAGEAIKTVRGVGYRLEEEK